MNKNIKQLTEKKLSGSEDFRIRCSLLETCHNGQTDKTYNSCSMIRDRIQKLLSEGWLPIQALPLDWSILLKDEYEITVFLQAPQD